MATRKGGLDAPVDAIARRSRAFNPQFQTIHEFAIQNYGAQLVAAANPKRIRLVVYAPASNTGTIELVAKGGTPPTGDRLSGPRAFDMEPGTGWELDDTLDAIYAYTVIGTGDQALQFWEVQDDGP